MAGCVNAHKCAHNVTCIQLYVESIHQIPCQAKYRHTCAYTSWEHLVLWGVGQGTRPKIAWDLLL